jgi:acetylornithine deacetylase/succinyl-diaminopimelate desuccinylase-like protein
VALLERLVAARSPNPPGDERAVADVIIAAAHELGLPQPQIVGPAPERPNVFIAVGSGAPALMLAAHMDTVPPVDPEAWTTDPYTLTLQGDRLVGLGAVDMKGSITAMLSAAQRIAAHPPARGRVVFAFTADEEEGSGEGMVWLCHNGHVDADAVVITEPCSMGEESWDALYVAHRGSFALRLVARGRPGHSGEEVPAAERASTPFGRALVALTDSDIFAGQVSALDGTPARLNVATTVRGGETPWAHPATLEATLEVRTLPGMTTDGVLADLRDVLAAAGVADCVTLEPLGDQAWAPPLDEVHDARLMRSVHAAWSDVLGTTPRRRCLPACTDASFVAALGIPTIPTFGPGSLAHVHQPGESLSRRDLSRAIDLFETLIRTYLDEPDGDGPEETAP